MAKNTSKNTKKTAKTTKKSTRSSVKTSKTATKTKSTKPTSDPSTSLLWRIFWTLICVVVSSCLLIAVDDAIFGTCDRIIASYNTEQSTEVVENTEVPVSLAWEGDVTEQLAKDIFVPIAFGTLFTVVEAYILYKARLLKRNATSAILIAALWLLPIALATIRLISFYVFTTQIGG